MESPSQLSAHPPAPILPCPILLPILSIGRRWSGHFDQGRNVAEGLIDEVAAFNKELSAAEVTEIYSSGFVFDYTTFSGVARFGFLVENGRQSNGNISQFTHS